MSDNQSNQSQQNQQQGTSGPISLPSLSQGFGAPISSSSVMAASNIIPSIISGQQPEADRSNKQKHAMEFLLKVRDQFSKTPDVYNNFLEVMKGFKNGSIDTPEVIQRVKILFRGNEFLITEFNEFLPPGFKIEPDEPPQPATTAPLETQADLEQARNYVRKIKTRFALQPHIYKRFLEILHSYYQGQHQIADVLEEVAELFSTHQDLLGEFTLFLPKTGGGAGIVDPMAQQKQQQLQHQQQQQQQAYQQPEPKRKPKRELKEKREPIKKEEKPKNTLQEERKRLKEIQKEQREAAKRKVRERDDFGMGLLSASPGDSTQDQDHTNQNTTTTTTTATTQTTDPTNRFSALTSPLYKELNFFNQVRERLQSKTLYEEFLLCIDLYSQGVINEKELLRLVGVLLGEHTDLQSLFRQFIGLDDSDLLAVGKANLSSFFRSKNRMQDLKTTTEIDMVIELNNATVAQLERIALCRQNPELKKERKMLEEKEREEKAERERQKREQEEQLKQQKEKEQKEKEEKEKEAKEAKEKQQQDIKMEESSTTAPTTTTTETTTEKNGESNTNTTTSEKMAVDSISPLKPKQESTPNATSSQTDNNNNAQEKPHSNGIVENGTSQQPIQPETITVRIADDLEDMDMIHMRNIERIYGCKGPEIIEALFAQPDIAIPIIVRRLKQKNIEWQQLHDQIQQM